MDILVELTITVFVNSANRSISLGAYLECDNRQGTSVSVMASTIICQLNQLFSNSEKYPTSLEKHNVFLLIPSFIVILFVLFGGSVGAVVFLHTQYGWEAVKQVGSLRNKESRNTKWRKITVRSAWMRLNILNSVNSNRLCSIRR